MIRPWFRQAAVPWKTTVTQTRASGENRVSTKPGVLQDREAFAAAGEACARLGWQYAVWGSAGPVPAANLRWLAGYRHPRCHDELVAGRLRAGCGRRSPGRGR